MPDRPENLAPPPESVSSAYVHDEKHIQPRPCLSIAGRRLKWYDIAGVENGVPEVIYLMALAFLERQAGKVGLDQLGEFGFVVLHRCGDRFYFLIACSWLGNNEIWETVFAKDADDPDFRDFPRAAPHLPTFCVWEMGAVAHESLAWNRFLRTKRDDRDIAAWLADTYEGTV